MVIDSSICANGNKLCTSPTPNYYDASSMSAQDSGSDTSNVDVTMPMGNVVPGANLAGNGYNTTDMVVNPFQTENLTLFLTHNITSHIGKQNYVPLSLLSLEPATNNASHTSSGAITPGQQTILQSYVSDTHGSGTVGMHMGSASYNQTGSLYLGGYDQNRLIEPPAVFENVGFVNLSSISFGHASGLDPWSSSSSDQPVPNFLQQNLPVAFSPHVANFLFPQSLCNLFMRYLPVTFDDQTNLYLWNTSSPLYTALMTSPSYMNFTFADTASTSIRIPFAMLNLTLTAPVKNNPTPYFPCQPRSDTTNLGRAFLQGAMFIQSYQPARIIVGQAPGPSVNGSTAANAQTLDNSNPSASPASGATKWEDTWAAHLTPLSSAPVPTSTSMSEPNSGNTSSGSNALSGGAIAGIVIGVLAGVALVAAAVFFFLRRRSATNTPVGSNTTAAMTEAPYAAGNTGAGAGAAYQKYEQKEPVPQTPAPAYSSGAPVVVPAFGGAQEIDGREGQIYHEAGGRQVAEAPGGLGPGQGFVAEMPDTSTRAEVGGTDTQRWSTQ